MTAQHLSSYHFYFKLNLKPRHFVVVEGIFLFPVFLGKILNFENILGVYKGSCSVKEKRKGNNAEKLKDRKSNLQRTQNPFSAPESTACANVIQLSG